MQKRALANLSHLPPHVIPLLRGALAGKRHAEAGDALGDPVRSRHHGAVQAVRTAMDAIGLPRLVARERCPERELVLAMVAGRILRPNSKLATTRWWRNTTLPEEFAIADDVAADDLYAAMDWLGERQEGIQGRLGRRWVAQDDLVLRDLSSTWHEGSRCPLARFGCSRDRKREISRRSASASSATAAGARSQSRSTPEKSPTRRPSCPGPTASSAASGSPGR